jgi:type III secretory pathway component EscV
MIVPLPTLLLDLLTSVNIATAVVLLLVAIYVSDALKIATFPTLLLLTTLFRLALEVSATRLILLHADGGEVIRAFGNFVVAGNLVVGAVIFLILTTVAPGVTGIAGVSPGEKDVFLASSDHLIFVGTRGPAQPGRACSTCRS